MLRVHLLVEAPGGQEEQKVLSGRGEFYRLDRREPIRQNNLHASRPQAVWLLL